jgi:hypothetical protein
MRHTANSLYFEALPIRGVKARNKLIMKEKRAKRAASKTCGLMICVSKSLRDHEICYVCSDDVAEGGAGGGDVA